MEVSRETEGGEGRGGGERTGEGRSGDRDSEVNWSCPSSDFSSPQPLLSLLGHTGARIQSAQPRGRGSTVPLCPEAQPIFPPLSSPSQETWGFRLSMNPPGRCSSGQQLDFPQAQEPSPDPPGLLVPLSNSPDSSAPPAGSLNQD